MCGISGYIGEGFKEYISLMNNAQKHRGPDGEGYFYDNSTKTALAHKRLSILDIAFGHQPFCNYDESVVLVYNGEIFNSESLRKELIKLGWKFKSDHSDTEVILKMYEQYGIEMVARLNGMFSFAIYDQKKNKIFGARDSFGIKPFFYSTLFDSFAFSSEIKALLAIPDYSKKISNEAVSHYLSFQCIPAPLSIYQGINKLPAAHFFEYNLTNKNFAVKRYWKPRFDNRYYQNDELLDLIRIKIDESVKRWSISDVEIGCSLSGGLDSSIVTTLATKNQQNLRTYTLGFEGFDDLDERSIARKVANIYGTKHTEIVITEKDIISSLPSMINALDEPYGGGLPSWFIYKEMSKDVKVCLTGTGGDELFGNYGKWKMYSTFRDYFYSMRRNILRLEILDILNNPKGSFYYKYFSEKEKKRVLNFSITQSSSSLIQQYWYAFSSKTSSDAVVSVDVQLQLPEEFLFMTDRFSMAFSLEARTPLLDLELVNFIYSISSEMRSKKTDLKYLLKQAFATMLPKDVIGGPKRGFVLPLNSWIKKYFKDDIDELFDTQYLKKQGIFNNKLASEIRHFTNNDYGNDKIWTLLMFQLWYKYSFNQE